MTSPVYPGLDPALLQQFIQAQQNYQPANSASEGGTTSPQTPSNQWWGGNYNITPVNQGFANLQLARQGQGTFKWGDPNNANQMYAVNQGQAYGGNGPKMATMPNQAYDLYDPTGKYAGSSKWANLDPSDQAMRQFITALAMVAAPIAGYAAFGGGAAGAGAGAAGAGDAGAGVGAAAAGDAGAAGAAGAGGAAAGDAGLAGTYGSSLAGGMGTYVPAGVGYTAGAPTLAGLGTGAASYGSGALGLDSALASMGAAGATGAALGTSGAVGSGTTGTTGTVGSTTGTGGLTSTATTGGLSSALSSLQGSGLTSLVAPLLGGLLGSQGVKNNQTSTVSLPSYLQGPVANDLIPRTQGLLNQQMPVAQNAANQMMTQGSALMNAPMAGNGYTNGAVKLNAPTTSTNPYLSGMANDIQNRTQLMLGQNNLAIQGNSVAAGGLGGSRQGVAQGLAAAQAADYFSGNLANMYGQQYSADQNRALQQYGMDQSFYGQQRGQDLGQVGIGSGLMSQGLQTPYQPLQAASGLYSPYSGFGTTTGQTSYGGGAMGALGGALGGMQFANNMGWLGSGSGSSGSNYTDATNPNGMFNGVDTSQWTYGY